jgi:hypothetical protein
MRSAALLLCLASAGLRRSEQLKRAAEEANSTAPELSDEVLAALTTKINAIDDSVGQLQEAVDTSAQNIFRSEMMAQNNRLNITGELGSLAESSIVVGKNALRLARISESAGVVNSSLLNQLDILATAHERALNASTFIESLVGEGGTFSEPGMENLTTLLGEARSAYERMGDLRQGVWRAHNDSANFSDMEAMLETKVHEALATELRPEVDSLREGLKRLAASTGKWDPVLGR